MSEEHYTNREWLMVQEHAKQVAALKAENAALKDLIREVISDHSDPDSPWYNECEPCDNEECGWCDEAKQILEAGNE